MRLAWHAKETDRGIYAIDGPDQADRFVTELADDMPDHPIEVRSLRRTLRRWHDPIVAWHHAYVSNGPTKAANNLIKRIRRIGLGFPHFTHYRLRALLHAGRPTWHPSPPLTPLRSDEPSMSMSGARGRLVSRYTSRDGSTSRPQNRQTTAAAFIVSAHQGHTRSAAATGGGGK
jgi:hypothetical protein